MSNGTLPSKPKTTMRQIVEKLDQELTLLQTLHYYYQETYQPNLVQGRRPQNETLTTLSNLNLLAQPSKDGAHPCTKLGKQALESWVKANKERTFKIGTQYYQQTKDHNEMHPEWILCERQKIDRTSIHYPELAVANIEELANHQGYHHYHYLKPYQPNPVEEELNQRYLTTTLEKP